jgi:alpha-galactosidase
MDSGTTRTPVELAQLAVANPALYPAFGGNVLTVDTRAPVLWRDPAASPANEGFHWNRNGETYFLIGDSMGEAMVDLLDP